MCLQARAAASAGKATIESVFQQFPPLEDSHKVSAEELLLYPEKLRPAQQAFDKTGGLHASGIFDANGEIRIMREDVGRHNALDKVIGHALLNDLLPLAGNTLVLSGRISFELMQKSLSAGIPVVAGISAPSSLAVEFCARVGAGAGGISPWGADEYLCWAGAIPLKVGVICRDLLGGLE